jgi:hypothetical protein
MKNVLILWLVASCTWNGGSVTARLELHVEPVYFYCGRQTWIDSNHNTHVSPTCFIGKRQRLLVKIGGCISTVEATNEGQGKAIVNGYRVKYREDGMIL